MTTALYRRYRPDTFEDVIGQDHVTVPLRTALKKNRVNHAYLFSGPRGCGKTTSARILARCLNCEQGPTPTPCGVCDSCVDLATGGSGSLDVIEIDAASHGGVDDARDLRERATFAPARDRFKIFIIDEAHMVTSAGFNALLKIVEEPPEHIKFIFATTEPEKVIGTIRSRTHHYPFRLIPPEPMMQYVQHLADEEHIAVAPGVLPLVVRAGGGSGRDTLSVLDQLMAGASQDGISYDLAVSLLGYTHAELLDDVVDALAAQDAATVFGAVDRVIQSGLDPRRFVEDLLERFRDLIVVRAIPENAAQVLHGVPQGQLERMSAQAAVLGPSELSRWGDVTNAALSEMTGATSPRLHLELLCARLMLPSADHAERGVAARVDRLERHLSFGGAPVEAGSAAASSVSAQGGVASAGSAPGNQAPDNQPDAAGTGWGGPSGAAAARQALRSAQGSDGEHQGASAPSTTPQAAPVAPQPAATPQEVPVAPQPTAATPQAPAVAPEPTQAPSQAPNQAQAQTPQEEPIAAVSDFVPSAEELSELQEGEDEFEPVDYGDANVVVAEGQPTHPTAAAPMAGAVTAGADQPAVGDTHTGDVDAGQPETGDAKAEPDAEPPRKPIPPVNPDVAQTFEDAVLPSGSEPAPAMNAAMAQYLGLQPQQGGAPQRPERRPEQRPAQPARQEPTEQDSARQDSAPRPVQPRQQDPTHQDSAPRPAAPAPATPPQATAPASDPASVPAPAQSSNPTSGPGEQSESVSGQLPHPQGGQGSVEMFRRAWPQIMDHLKDSRRFIWSMVNPNVSIAGFDGRTLVLAFANQGPMLAFRQRPEAVELLRTSIREVLGVDPAIDVTSGGSGPSGDGGPKADGRPTPAVAEQSPRSEAPASPAPVAPVPTTPAPAAAVAVPAARASASPAPVAPAPASSEPAAPQPAAPQPSSSEPASPQPASSEPTAPQPATPQPAATASSTPEPGRRVIDPSLIVDREEPWDDWADGPAPEDSAWSTPARRGGESMAQKPAAPAPAPEPRSADPEPAAAPLPRAATPPQTASTTAAAPAAPAPAAPAPAAPVPVAPRPGAAPSGSGSDAPAAPAPNQAAANAPAAPAPARGGWDQAPTAGWGAAPEEVEAPAPARPSRSGPRSKYQQLMDQAKTSDTPQGWGSAPKANTGADRQGPPVDLNPDEFVPSEDDEELENSTTFGRAALERLLDAKLIEELDHQGQPLPQRR